MKVIAAPIVGAIEINAPNPAKSGPIAATTPPTTAIIFKVFGDNSENLAATIVANCATLANAGANASPKLICAASTADLTRATEPDKVLSIISAIFFADPPEFS